MLDRLKEAHYRRRYDSERAALILRVEREIADLPRKEVPRGWTEWLWSLPPEAWLEAVALKKAQIRMLAQREVAVRAITRKNKLLMMLEQPEKPGEADRARLMSEAETAVAEAERIKGEAMDLELDFRARSLDLHERFGVSQEPAKESEPLRPTESIARKADRWQAWLQTVPPERRDEARRVRALDADLENLKKRLIQAVTEKNKLEIDGAGTEETRRARVLAEAMKQEYRRLDATYRRLSSPLFEAVGEPDLTECVGD